MEDHQDERAGELSYEERLTDLRLFSLEERRLCGVSSMPINTWREGAKRIGPVFFQCYQVPGQEVAGTKCSTGGFLRAPGRSFVLRDWWSTDTDGLESTESHPWRSSELTWPQAWAPCSGWSCCSRGWVRWTQRSLTTSTTQSFRDTAWQACAVLSQSSTGRWQACV